MKEAGLRIKLAAALGRSDLPDALWNQLVRDGFVPDVLSGDERFEPLVQRAREYLNLMRAGGPEIDSEPRELTPPKQSLLSKRMHAVSTLLANEAAEYDPVVNFRREVLGDKLLKADEVEDWIHSQYSSQPGITYWASEVPLPVGTNILKHSGNGYLFTDPPLLVNEKSPTIGKIEVRDLSYRSHVDSSTKGVSIYSGGPLGRLWRLCEKLQQIFGWNQTQCTSFVLTGEPPLIPPAWLKPDFRTPYEVTSRITLEIDPAVSPKEVAQFYRNARSEVVSNRYRSQSQKHLQLAVFSVSRSESEPWADQLAAWNEKYPDWAYTSDRVKNFSRDCQQARRRLLHPDFRNPVVFRHDDEEESDNG